VDVLIPKATFRVRVPPQQVGTVYDAVSKVGGSTAGEEYGADGSLTVIVTCDLEFHDKLRIGLIDGTRGEALFPNYKDDNDRD
jgi:ribosome maturation protein Sdo1